MKQKILINYTGGKWQYLTLDVDSDSELIKVCQELSLKSGVDEVQLCLEDVDVSELKTEDATKDVYCSDVADVISLDK